MSKIEEKLNEVMKSEEFLDCPPEILKNILEMDTSCSPASVFDDCMRWAEKKCEKNGLDPSVMGNRKKELGECFYLIPFPMMRAVEISDCISKYKEMFDRDELVELFAISVSKVKPAHLKIFKKNTMCIRRPVNVKKHFFNILEYSFEVDQKCGLVGHNLSKISSQIEAISLSCGILHIFSRKKDSDFWVGFYSENFVANQKMRIKPERLFEPGYIYLIELVNELDEEVELDVSELNEEVILFFDTTIQEPIVVDVDE